MSTFNRFFSWNKIKEILSRSKYSTTGGSHSVDDTNLEHNLVSINNWPWNIGAVVFNRYEITKVIQSGGMGLLYIAFDFKQMKHVVLKTFKDKFLTNEAAVTSFNREAQTWIGLSPHPNIVQAEILLTIENRPFIVMEYVAGDNLRAWINRPRLNLIQVFDFAIQFCLGMVHAHRASGLIHRDIKPENVMINKKGILKITDFGLAKLLRESFLEQVASSSQKPEANVDELALVRLKGGFGTSFYMPPEQFEVARGVDVEADIYSFGVMLFEMSTGQRPFRDADWREMRRQHQAEPPPNPQRMNSKIPVNLSSLILKCLAKNPSQRYSNFESLRVDLENIYLEIAGKSYQSPPTMTEQMQCELAVQHIKRGEFEQALDACEQALFLNSESAKAWLYKADIFVRIGKYNDALKGYDRALRISSRLVQVWNNQGLVLHMQGKDKEALQCYEQALKYDHDHYPAWNNRALSLFSLKRFKEALVDLDQALALKPDFADAWFNRGGVLDELSQPIDALAAFDKVIELTPHNPRPWKHKATVYATRLGQIEDALYCLDQALTIDPEDQDALEHREALVRNLEQHYGTKDVSKWMRAVVPDVRKADQWNQMLRGLHQGDNTVLGMEIRMDRSQVSHVGHQIISMFGLGNYAETIRYAEQALASDPTDAVAWTYKGVAFAELGQEQEGLKYINHALTLDSTFFVGWNFKGIVLHNLRQYGEAIASYDEALRLEPKSQSVWNNKGNSLKQLHHYEEALDCFDQALELSNTDAITWCNKGATFLDLGRYNDALSCANRALQLDPRLALSWHHKGAALEKLERYTEALQALDRAVELDPRSYETWQTRAEVLVRLDRFAEAEQAIGRSENLKKNRWTKEESYLAEAVEARIGDVKPGVTGNMDRLAIATTMNDLGRFEESIAYCDEVLSSEPKSELALTLKLAALDKMKRYESVLACYDKLLAIRPHDSSTWQMRGKTLRDLGRMSEALESFDKSLSLNPSRSETAAVWDAKGEVLEQMGHSAQALQCYDQALEIDPRFEWAWVNKGLILHNQGDNQQAVRFYDRALAINPANDAAWNNKGNALSLLKADAEEVLYCYVQAIRLNPSNPLVLNNAGVVYLGLQRYTDALEYFEKAITLRPNYPDAWYNKATSLKRVGRIEDALASFDETLRLDSNHSKAWSDKGLLLGQQGQLVEALRCLDRSLSLSAGDYISWFNKGALLFNAKRYREALVCFDQALTLAPNDEEMRQAHQTCLQAIKNNGN